MCGIAGVFYADRHRPADPEVLRAMGRAIAHRGPDADGFLSEPGIGLVHRRLSIIDLAGGGQPISNENGSIQIVFNGEIYNFEPLRSDLESRGHRFRTRSDTEVLVHLYEEMGEHLVTRLRGMFAFALWDRPRRRLVLARDRVGQKPLFIYRDPEKVVFGSELKAVLAHPGVQRELDPSGLEDYLAFGMIPAPRSILRGVEKLPPAHWLALTADALDAPSERYWTFRPVPVLGRSVGEWKEAINEKLEETVRAHKIADVPVGAFLSGGLDSSSIVAALARNSSSPIQTFSIGFEDRDFTELPYAREIAARYGTIHVEEVVTPTAAQGLEKLVRYYDEPFADTSAIPTLWVSEVARRHVKVVLSGDGGDEAFGGYSRYAHDLSEARWRYRLPEWFRRGPLAALADLWPKADWLPRYLRAKTRLTNLSRSAADAYSNTLSLCRMPLRRRLLEADVRAALDGHRPESAIVDAYAAAPSSDPLLAMIMADVAVVLPDDFLAKVDRASMSVGLEVRPPLVDHEFLELAGSIPSDLKIKDGQSKWIFKEAVAHLLPPGFTSRPKHGFEVPIDDWIRGPLAELFTDTVLSPSSPAAPWIDQNVAAGLARSHRAGTGRHGHLLWSLLVLAAWAQRYLPAPTSRSAMPVPSCV
jgi:asparagine synthase (glutamine-hydrolysing)